MDKLKFIAIFFILGIIGQNMPFTQLIGGGNVSFTLFDFFAPIAGAFLGPLFGILTVLGVEITNIIVKQTPIELGSIIRLFPVLFATYYFAVLTQNKKSEKAKSNTSKFALIVPLVAIIAFVAHPIGRTVPYFTLFWTIPFIAYFFRRNDFMRALGATFTQHAVGGAAWIWAFNLPTEVWGGLVPVVISERLVFAVGIAITYKLMKYLFGFLADKKILPSIQNINSHYIK